MASQPQIGSSQRPQMLACQLSLFVLYQSHARHTHPGYTHTRTSNMHTLIPNIFHQLADTHSPSHTKHLNTPHAHTQTQTQHVHTASWLHADSQASHEHARKRPFFLTRAPCLDLAACCCAAILSLPTMPHGHSVTTKTVLGIHTLKHTHTSFPRHHRHHHHGRFCREKSTLASLSPVGQHSPEPSHMSNLSQHFDLFWNHRMFVKRAAWLASRRYYKFFGWHPSPLSRDSQEHQRHFSNLGHLVSSQKHHKHHVVLIMGKQHSVSAAPNMLVDEFGGCVMVSGPM